MSFLSTITHFLFRKHETIYESPDYVLVNNSKSLKAMINELNKVESCCMDTEADSMHHYQEKLCLIQISAGEKRYLLDPLSGLDLSEFWKTSALSKITFHAGDYDLLLLGKTYNFYPVKIYDTSIAAKLLGEKQTGLAAMVKKYFKRELAKENQKADWTKRPLPPAMCNYAVLDTVYLDELREMQIRELRKLGRLEWLEQSCDNLLKNTKGRYSTVSDSENKEGWRIKGSNSFKPLEQNILRALWLWRDAEAKRRDLASFRVLNPYLMLNMVKSIAACKNKIEENTLPKLPRNIRKYLMQSFLSVVNAARFAEPADYPAPLPRVVSQRTAINDDLRDSLKELRNNRAQKLGIDSGLLAKQSQLNILADAEVGDWENKFAVAAFMPWQKEIWQELIGNVKVPRSAQDLREWAKKKLAEMQPEKCEKESQYIIKALDKHPVLETGYVAAFFPVKNEPQIIPYIEKLAKEKRLLLPRLKGKNDMEFVLIKDLEGDLKKGSLGVMEPKGDLPAFSEPPAAFVVPGVVFAKDGGRIGRGAGYYDNFLANHKDIPRIGVAYSVQVRISIPQTERDIKMNEVIRFR